MTSYRNPAQKASSEKSPSLPWPLPPDGYQVEVSRWWHPPTERKNAWVWVYVVRVSIWNPADPDGVEIGIQGGRFAEDYLTKRQNRWEAVWVGEEVYLEPKALRMRKPPSELRAAFDQVVVAVRRKAALDERCSTAVSERAGVSW